MASTPFEAERQEPERAAETQAARRRKTREAMTWLSDYLHGQAMPADAIIAEAARLGIARTTLQTAKERLHIRSVRHAAGWTWYPPKSRKKHPVAK